jgi:DNA helicase-2/ATP-dependent DNA helicase PcrA
MSIIKLDKEQKKAVYAPVDQSLLIVAPPGCGKTLIMAKRIEYLVRVGAIRFPSRILGLTFTNAAANEMEDRVIEEIPEARPLVHITNFHSLGYSILRAYGNKVEISRKFAILGELEKQDLLLSLLAKYEPSIKSVMDSPPEERAQKLQNNEVWYRHNEWILERLLKQNASYEDGEKDSLFEGILEEFRFAMNSQGRLDFNHLLYYAYQILEQYQVILDYYRAAYRYVLVDEFQDTNNLQFNILALLTSSKRATSSYHPPNVFLLADPDQAIYEFQGATPGNIEVAKDLFNCKEIPLYKDYRFTSEAVKALKSSISNFINNRQSSVPTIPEEAPSFTVFDGMDGEAEFIFTMVKEAQSLGTRLHEIAIIAFPQYRLSLVKKKLDDEDISNIFVPDFRAGNIERRYRKIFKGLSSLADKRIKGGNLFLKVSEICQSENFNIEDDEVLQVLLKIATGYDRTQFQRRPLWEKIQLFTNEVLLEINWGQVLRERIKDKVFLSTIHGVKGLQFEKIMICGMEKYSFPTGYICIPCSGNIWRAEYKERELIKSLKILYVGISRSKNSLNLTCSSRARNGMYRPVSCLLGPFIQFLSTSQDSIDFCSTGLERFSYHS